MLKAVETRGKKKDIVFYVKNCR